MPTSFQTSGNYFKNAGYETNFIGKWHLGQRYMNETPNARGYDYFFGILGGTIDSYNKHIGLLCGTAENNFTAVFGDNCQFINAYDFQENGVPHIDMERYASDILTDKAIARFSAHDKSKGMLMHYHTNAPHAPLLAPQQLIDNCAGVSEGAKDVLRPYFRQVVCAMVSSTDIDVLRILFGLALNNMLPSTLFLFNSDNGGLTIAGSLNTPYRGQKGATFEGGIRAAAFMFGNGLHLSHQLQAERNDLVSIQDILPTLLGYAGVTPKSNWFSSPFDGYNFWGPMTLGLPFARQHVPVVSACEALGYFSAYIQKIGSTTWKYLVNPSVLEFVSTSSLGTKYEQEGEFLFNLSLDPYETTNLAKESTLTTTVVLNLLRARTLAMRYTGAPSQLTQFPPVIDLPPSDNGCWLALDSPNFATAVCPLPEGQKLKGMFKVGDRFNGENKVGAADEVNQYITADLNI